MGFFGKMFGEGTEVSSMRVMSFGSVVCAMLIAFYGMWSQKDLSQLAVLCGAFLGAGMGGKAVQKFAETKDDAKP